MVINRHGISMKITAKKVKWYCTILLLLLICFILFAAVDIKRF